jgi:hypothetical protein
LQKENVEEVIIEPIYDDSIVKDSKGGYAMLTPDEFNSMTDKEIKEWYKNNKNK